MSGQGFGHKQCIYSFMIYEYLTWKEALSKIREREQKQVCTWGVEDKEVCLKTKTCYFVAIYLLHYSYSGVASS